MGGTEGVSDAKGGRAAAKAARPFKADDFKRAIARAVDGAGGAPQAIAPAPAPREAVAPEGAFRARIARLESSAMAAGEGYGARNAAFGALGRYQLTPQSLRDLGWKDAAGRWTALAARNGVASDADFLGHPAAQEAAMNAYLRRAEVQLRANGSLGRSGTEIAALDGTPLRLTEAGLVAAAHRRGAGGVARYLAHREAGSEAPLAPSDRRAFAAVERRLRDFAGLPYAAAARNGHGTPAA